MLPFSQCFISKEAEESRVISVSAQGNLLSIHIENVCTHPVAYADGEPVTSKEDNIYHGYDHLDGSLHPSAIGAKAIRESMPPFFSHQKADKLKKHPG